MQNENQQTLSLVDNHFGDPTNGGYGHDVSLLDPQHVELLSRYSGKLLNQWLEPGVLVFPDTPHGVQDLDDESAKLAFFTIESNQEGTKRWINTGNCMGVVKLRNQITGASVQIGIGSRFPKDKNKKQLFLTYLLSKVFGGSMVDPIELGIDSLWDMLLAFVFRRRLLEASAVGLFKQYQTFKHNDARIRGRIDVNEHLRRNIPFCGTVAYATHEITFNNPTNHLIRHALAKANRKWGAILADDGLMDVQHGLEQNTPTWQPSEVGNCIRLKENRFPIKHPYFHAVYEPLRQISLSILRDEGASLYQQDQEAEGVIFDGSWLWEKYLWTLLEPLGFEHADNKKSNQAWIPLRGVSFYPDFFHQKARAILDAKYKRGENRCDGRQEHAKQVFGYMFLLDAIHGGLVKPDGIWENPEPIRRKGFEVEQSFWHDFVLTPSIESTGEAFVAEMHEKEEAFTKHVTRTLKIKTSQETAINHLMPNREPLFQA